MSAPSELSLGSTATDLAFHGLEPGVDLAIAADGHTLFRGQISGLGHEQRADGSEALLLQARDPLQLLARRGSARAHLDLDIVAMADELCRSLGIRARSLVAARPRHRIEQQHQSDLDLLVTAAERAGLSFVLRGDWLDFFGASGLDDPVLPLRSREELLELRVQRTGAAAAPVSVRGWSPALAQDLTGHARSPIHPNAARAGAAPPGSDGPGRLVLLNELLDDEADAETVAQAELDRRTGALLTLEGTALGDPRLEPGRRVRIEGTHEAFAGTFVLTQVTHVIDREGGFVSRIATAPPPRRAPGRPSVAFGIVSRIDDPLRLGRVQVRLPAADDLETDWLAVVTPGAGIGKGVVSLPDVGDRVLVLLLGGESGEALVLGGLYGDRPPPDSERDQRRLSFVSPGGQRLILDDQQTAARLEIANDSFLELGKESATLHAATDLLIEAPGRTVTIRAARIDFEQG